MKRVMLVFGLSVCLLSVRGQDSLSLKSGKVMAGEIISFADNTVRIRIKSDTLNYKLDEIKSLRYNGPVTAKNIQMPSQTETENRDRKKEIKGVGISPVKIER